MAHGGSNPPFRTSFSKEISRTDLSNNAESVVYASFVRIFPNTSANNGPLQPLMGIVRLGCRRFHPLQRFNQSHRRAPQVAARRRDVGVTEKLPHVI